MSTLPKYHDWHNADIVAALHKRGISLRQLSEQNDYAATSLSQALRRPWPKAERLIANAIGVDPADIWPKRYQKRKRQSLKIGTAAQNV